MFMLENWSVEDNMVVLQYFCLITEGFRKKEACMYALSCSLDCTLILDETNIGHIISDSL